MAAASSLEKIVNEGIDVGEDIANLGRMAATKSLHRNLKTEDAAVRRDYEQGMGIDSGNGPLVPAGDGEDMDIMVAHGDVHIYERPKEPKQEAAAVAVASSPPLPQVLPSPVSQSKLPAMLTAAALLGGGTLGGAGLASLLLDRSPPNTPEFTDTDTRSGLGLVPPGPPVSKQTK